ncbi:MAG: hypothetical protein U0P30_15995 [Vicinamibacterales bacterium]
MTRSLLPTLFALAILTSFAAPAAAQGGGYFSAPTTNGEPRQVISANPFGLVMDFYNAEYELKVADAVTAGVGASRRGWILFGESQERPRLNSDVFVRYYPFGSAFNGVAIGVKVGATRMPDHGTYPGFGFDLNHSYAFTDHAVISTGIGMKRLIGRDSYAGPETITTFRINIGLGF